MRDRENGAVPAINCPTPQGSVGWRRETRYRRQAGETPEVEKTLSPGSKTGNGAFGLGRRRRLVCDERRYLQGWYAGAAWIVPGAFHG